MKTILQTIILMISIVTFSQEKLIKPPYLQKGDTIAIVTPAGILKNRKATVQKAKKLAEKTESMSAMFGEKGPNGHLGGVVSSLTLFAYIKKKFIK